MSNNNAFAGIFGFAGAIFGAILPFWLGWAKLDTGASIASQPDAVTTGLVGPVLMGLTGAIFVGMFAMVLGMVLDGYAKKE